VTVEILNTGTELLLGDVVNSHPAAIAERLATCGLRVARQTAVPDGPAIREVLGEAVGRCDLLFVTGGLGPTTDDVTREEAAGLLGLPLDPSPEVEDAIRARFAARGREMPARVLRQAMVPRGARVLPNPHGTAPGLYLEPGPAGGGRVSPHMFLLPGPPRELLPMLDAHVMPVVRGLCGGRVSWQRRTYHVTGMGESLVEAMVGLALTGRGDIEVGYCARPNEVDLRLIAEPCVLDEIEPAVFAALGDHLMTIGTERIEEIVVRGLVRLGRTVATAESCTGGMLANRLTDVPGASRVFRLGLVTYADEEKTARLGVPEDLIRREGAVSATVAEAMAAGVLALSGADFALSLTGIAGPSGGSPEKPVGTVFAGFAGRGIHPRAQHLFFPSDRATFKHLATQYALDTLRRHLTAATSRV
jgi:nicotinamide-nucleotide amidase